MADYSNRLYHQLEQETGIQTGYMRTGSIFLAQTQDRLVSLKRINSRLNVIGIPSEIISLKKVTELHPLLNVHDLVGAMHVPEDAVVSSADVALALASAASQQDSGSQLCQQLVKYQVLNVKSFIRHDVKSRGRQGLQEEDGGPTACRARNARVCFTSVSTFSPVW
ncbi:pyruvate dehydrogenase phosphatase regulatory subunit, mitochondrial-like [Saccopteryx leptura]|uniref:pyruvate dehydrogenase phosphatase regulatory subunit, mitochondrial-like n=1 Tax=Saccopteryx leptura TaxID=249018 RepID=UPI00339C122D